MDKLWDQTPSIIREAAKSRRGVLSLLILVVAAIALVFFKDASEGSKNFAFVMVMSGFGMLCRSLLRNADSESEASESEASESETSESETSESETSESETSESETSESTGWVSTPNDAVQSHNGFSQRGTEFAATQCELESLSRFWIRSTIALCVVVAIQLFFGKLGDSVTAWALFGPSLIPSVALLVAMRFHTGVTHLPRRLDPTLLRLAWKATYIYLGGLLLSLLVEPFFSITAFKMMSLRALVYIPFQGGLIILFTLLIATSEPKLPSE